MVRALALVMTMVTLILAIRIEIITIMIKIQILTQKRLAAFPTGGDLEGRRCQGGTAGRLGVSGFRGVLGQATVSGFGVGLL